MQLVYPPCCLPELYLRVLRKVHPQLSYVSGSAPGCKWDPLGSFWNFHLGPTPDHLNQNLWCETRAWGESDFKLVLQADYRHHSFTEQVNTYIGATEEQRGSCAL